MADASLKDRIALHSPNMFKLGLFAMNCSSGTGLVTTVPERWSGSWEDNLALAQMADEAGIEFMLPLARWKGYGGPSDHQGKILEPLTWAVAILAKTKRLTAFATMHVPLFHPVAAAKQMMVADQVGQGRFGLNIVCGWNEGEFDMFGVELREHATRYEHAQEWIDIVLKCWSDEEDFSYQGKFFNLKNVRSKPKPYGGTRPIFMNAANSETGQEYAGRNCDAYFGRVRREFLEDDAAKVMNIKAIAAKSGRSIEVFTAGSVICRPTQKEADDYYHYAAVENVEWDAVDYMLKLRGTDVATLEPDERKKVRLRAATGGGGLPIVGTPDLVANHLAELHRVGLRGFGMALINYTRDLPLIRDEVMPRLERLGLRRARQTA